MFTRLDTGRNPEPKQRNKVKEQEKPFKAEIEETLHIFTIVSQQTTKLTTRKTEMVQNVQTQYT